MNNALKKIWPYLLGLLVLFGVAIVTEDYLPFNLFGDHEDEGMTTVLDSSDTYSDSVDAEPEAMIDTSEQDTVVVVEQEVERVRQWHLVVGSVPDKERAEAFASRFRDNHPEIRYIERLDTYRIIYGSYMDLREAQLAYESIKNDYPDAWVVLF